MVADFLTKDQVCGKNCLSIFKRYGTNAAVTDISILLGCGVTNNHTSDSIFNDFDTRSADYYTKTKSNSRVIAISSYGFGYNGEKSLDDRFVGIRPILNYSDIVDNSYDRRISDKEVLEVKFGEYPQTICVSNMCRELEQLYNSGALIESGKKYSFDSNIVGDFSIKEYSEYLHEGKKYIRFTADRDLLRTKLSDKNYIEYNKAYWVNVEPIIWLIDLDENIAVSKKILIAGIPFDKNYDSDFEHTDIFDYLNNYFVNEILSSDVIKKESKTDLLKKQLDDLSLEELQELRLIVEEKMREKVKVRSIGGIK